MRGKNRKTDHLKVISGHGKDTAVKSLADLSRKPIYFLLLLLALFLLAQILAGWVWGTIGYTSVRTFMAYEDAMEVPFSIRGMLTFEEDIVLAPQAGFVYYNIEEGKRVSAGKVLAQITGYPVEERSAHEDEKRAVARYAQKVKDWFLQGDEDSDYSGFFPVTRELLVKAPQPGLVSLHIDGWEKYGPHSQFPYLREDELPEEFPGGRALDSGERVYRLMPIIKIMNNYRWYFSAVITFEQWELISGQSSDRIYFSFAPETPVWGERVEVNSNEHGEVEVTWQIDRRVGNFFEQRWSEAKIVYDTLKGVVVPAGSLLEVDGVEGVYVVEGGKINFREITVIAEKEDYFLVGDLEHNERVVKNPSRVKEGQSFFW